MVNQIEDFDDSVLRYTPSLHHSGVAGFENEDEDDDEDENDDEEAVDNMGSAH
jgi:hypothetical protein